MEPEVEKEREPAERRWYSAERAREDMAEIEAEWQRRLDRTMAWAVVFGAASAAAVTLALHLLWGI
jgi:uncharacterized membrane protein